MVVRKATSDQTEDGKRASTLALSLALLLGALLTTVNQAAGQNLERGILTLAAGYNFVALPYVNTSLTASSFLDTLGDAAQSISYYDSATQSYVTYDRYLEGFGVQEDFAIQPDVGYVVYSTRESRTSIYGIRAGSRSIYLRPGYNLVGWSSQVKFDAITAFVNRSSGLVERVSTFDQPTQQFVTYDKNLAEFGVPQHDFDVRQGEAYFVYSKDEFVLDYGQVGTITDRSIDKTTTNKTSRYTTTETTTTLETATATSTTTSPSSTITVAKDGSGDYNDIQDGIDAVEALGGGTLYIKAGVYEIFQALIVPGNIEIVGDGMEVTVLLHTYNSDFPMMTNKNPSIGDENITIRNLTFDGNAVPNPGSTEGCGITFTNVSHAYFQRILVKRIRYDGLVANDEFRGSGACQDWQIRNSVFQNNGVDGVSLKGLSGFLIEDCIFEDNGQLHNCPADPLSSGATGLTLGREAGGEHTQNGTVLRCHFRGHKGDGARTNGARDITFDACHFYNNSGDGINLDRDIEGEDSTRITITNSYVYDNSRNGIWLRGNPSFCTIQNCVVSSNSQLNPLQYDGIRLWCATPHDNIIQGNTCFDDQVSKTQRFGIYTESPSRDNLIKGNDCRGNGHPSWDIVICPSDTAVNNLGRQK